MIAEYEAEDRRSELSSPRQYGIAQTHKHLPEMKAISGIKEPPVFCPVVADFYSGMQVTIPLSKSMLVSGKTVDDIINAYKEKYQGPIVSYVEDMSDGGFIGSNNLSGYDNMQISVSGNDDRILLLARYDNLGKGASGAAVECMNIAMGADPTTSLVIKEVNK